MTITAKRSMSEVTVFLYRKRTKITFDANVKWKHMFVLCIP